MLSGNFRLRSRFVQNLINKSSDKSYRDEFVLLKYLIFFTLIKTESNSKIVHNNFDSFDLYVLIFMQMVLLQYKSSINYPKQNTE